MPLSKLTAAPFSLLRGYSIHFKVIATNPYGDSLASDSGNGGIVVLVPDSPINLQNDLSVTTASVIKFTWDDGAQNGGESIIDYRVSYDQSTGNFVVLASGVLTREYTTDVTLEAGQFYTFKVEAQNSVGYSAYSAELSILAAQKPD